MHLTALAALSLAAFSVDASAIRLPSLYARQGGPGNVQGNNTRDPYNISSYYATGYQNGDLAPGAWLIDALGQTVQVGNSSQMGNDSASQVPWCPTIFVGAAESIGNVQTGWTQLPNVTGFDFHRDIVIDNSTGAVVPYYIERKDWSKVKRAIAVNPGLARDVWSYMSLVRNSLICAATNDSLGVGINDVMVGGVAWMSKLERSAGAAGPNDVYFDSWSDGTSAAGPGNTNATSFEALDLLVDFWFNRTNFPNLNSVVIAGHSLGGSFTQRYAVLRKPNSEQDPYMRFFSGNPGAYVEVTEQPALTNLSQCQSGGNYTEWPYGIDSNIPAYQNATFSANLTQAKNVTLDAFFGRKVATVCGLADHGSGDTHPAAQCEGDSHLSRCLNFQKSIEGIPGNPAGANHTFDFLQYVAHQDYQVYSHPASQERLFSNGLNDTRSTSSGSNDGGAGASSGAASSSSSGSRSASASASGSSSSGGSTSPSGGKASLSSKTSDSLVPRVPLGLLSTAALIVIAGLATLA